MLVCWNVALDCGMKNGVNVHSASVVSGAEGMQPCPGGGEDWILSGEDFLVSRPGGCMRRDGC